MDQGNDDIFDEFAVDDQTFLQALAHVEEAGAAITSGASSFSLQSGPNPHRAATRIRPIDGDNRAPPKDHIRDAGSAFCRQTTLFESLGGRSASGQTARTAAPGYHRVPSKQTTLISGGGPIRAVASGNADDDTTRTSPKDLAGAGYIPDLHKMDEEAIKTWIFPTNVSLRDYQFNIISKGLFYNTLVALPTGLGKTFIAAVMMFNYFRWFPEGKIVFMAPTKPLVAQQIEACFKITGLPQDATIELTGATAPDIRMVSWLEKRVFFLTPQVMQNDLNRGTCPANKVVLLVVDEAHRATGNHSYCEVIRELRQRNQRFRILALTATPGSDIKTVQNVIENTLISRIEIRTEDSLDIKPFIHHRTVDAITVPLSGQILEIRAALNKVCEPFLARLAKGKAFFRADASNMGKYELLKARERWREESRGSGGGMTPGRAAGLEGDFGVAMMLAGALQLLTVHGIRTCYSTLSHYIQESQQSGGRVSRSRGELCKNPNLVQLMKQIENMITLPTFSSHPKLERLVITVVQHFLEHQEEVARLAQQGRSDEIGETRVMIFSQYRDSVEEIKTALEEHDPLVRVMSFVGQAAAGKSNKKGFTQKEQLEVISKFQKGNYNVLVATSIGEEGLDIGEVDLIICFDAQNSPIRMLQRMGRTGRKREGKIVLLLTEGKEEEAHKRSQSQYKSVQKAILNQQGKKLQMYPDDMCRMLPPGPKPVCVKTHLEIPEYQSTKRSKKAAKVKEVKVPKPKAPRKTAAKKKAGSRKRKAAESEDEIDLPQVSDSDDEDSTMNKPAKKRKRPLDLDKLDETFANLGNDSTDDDAAFDSDILPEIAPVVTPVTKKPRRAKAASAKEDKSQRASKEKIKDTRSPNHMKERVPRRLSGGIEDLMDDGDDDVDEMLMSEIPFALRSAKFGAADRFSDSYLSFDTADEPLRKRKRGSTTLDVITPPPKSAKPSSPGNNGTVAAPEELPLPDHDIDQSLHWANDEGCLIFDPSVDESVLEPIPVESEDMEWESAISPIGQDKDVPALLSSPLLVHGADEWDEPGSSEIPVEKATSHVESVTAEKHSNGTSTKDNVCEGELEPTTSDFAYPSEDDFFVDDAFFAELDNIEALEEAEVFDSQRTTQRASAFKFTIPEPISNVSLQTTETPTRRAFQGKLNAENAEILSVPRTPAPAGRDEGAVSVENSPLMVKSNRRIIDLGGDDEFAGSQWASQVASTRKRIRKVKAVHKHISPVSIIKSPGSPAVKQTRQTRVESLLARLAQKKAPRKLPAHRGSPKLPTVVVTRSTERQPKSGRPSKSVSNEPNPFMDIEAEESDGDGAHSGDEEATEDWDQDLSGFVVNDHDTPARSRGSQSAPSTGDLHASPTDMRAFYQKSLLSPSMGGMGQRAHGGYKFAWGRSTPGRRRRPYAETPTRRNDVEEDEEDDSLSGFVVDDEDELSDLHGVKTPGTQSACVSQIENQDDDGEDLFLDSTRDPTHAEVNDGPAAGGWEMDSPLAQKKRSERKLERGTGNDSGSSRGGAIFSNHARSGQTGTDSRRFKDSASAEHDLLADTAGRIDQANALHTVTDDPELDELAQSAIEDSMNIDWEDDQWDYLAETPAKPQTSSSRLVMTPLNTKTPRSNALAANKASPFSPFAMHGPSPLKPIEELTEEQKGVLLVEHDPHAHIHRVQQCVQSKVTILVDTREMRSSICSKLRNIHNVRVEIRQLAFGDYVLSNRIAVERKTRADLLSSVFNKRVYEQISNLKAMCDRPILLIEADEENSESMAATAQYEGIIASLLRMQITVLFSESTDYSAHLLFTLATKEAREGASMDVPDMLPAKNNQAVQFLMSIPGVSDVTAIAIMNSRFKSLREFVNCSPADMVARIPGLSLGRAKKIHNFLQASAVPAKQANDKQDVEFA